jgi:hypothetical protein
VSKFIRARSAPKKPKAATSSALENFKPWLENKPEPLRGVTERGDPYGLARKFIFEGPEYDRGRPVLYVWNEDGTISQKAARHTDAGRYAEAYAVFIQEIRQEQPHGDYDPEHGWRDHPGGAFVRFDHVNGRVLRIMTSRTLIPNKFLYVGSLPAEPEDREKYPRAWSYFFDLQGPNFRDPFEQAPEPVKKPGYVPNPADFGPCGPPEPFVNRLDKGHAAEVAIEMERAAKDLKILSEGGMQALVNARMAEQRDSLPWAARALHDQAMK